MVLRREEGEENVVITDDVVWLPSSISPEADPSSHPHSSSLSVRVRGTLNLETCFFFVNLFCVLPSMIIKLVCGGGFCVCERTRNTNNVFNRTICYPK